MTGRRPCYLCGRRHSAYSGCRSERPLLLTKADVVELALALVVWSALLFGLLYLLPAMVQP